MEGIYGYYDRINQYVIYIGKDSHIDKNKRHSAHMSPCNKNKQKINQILQNDKNNRYIYFVFIKGNYTNKELNNFEKEYIKKFKTFKYDNMDKKVFNFTPGGEYSPSQNPKIAKKISQALLGKNNPMYGKMGKDNPNYNNPTNYCHTKKVKKKISNFMKNNNPMKKIESRKKISQINSGYGNPNAKYTLWDIRKCCYKKYNMRQYKKTLNPYKCFALTYHSYKVPIGLFYDFYTPELLYNLIKKEEHNQAIA